jgi:hypothetical protein
MIRRLQVFAFLVLIVGAANSTRAEGITGVDIFKNILYTQSSGASPTTPSLYFADLELRSQTLGDFTDVSVTYPGPASPTSLPEVSPTFFSYGPPFGTQAAMDAAIPFGAYDFAATNSGTSFSQTATLNYSTDAFTSAIPALSAASFSALNGLNPTTALTVGFNSFTPNAAASEGFTFFSIFNGSGTFFSDGFLAPNSTSLILPAGTLAANTTYLFELDFSDRINGTDPAISVPTLVGSDVRTDGTFTTGPAFSQAPEPSALLLGGSALLVLAAFRKRLSEAKRNRA